MRWSLFCPGYGTSFFDCECVILTCASLWDYQNHMCHGQARWDEWGSWEVIGVIVPSWEVNIPGRDHPQVWPVIQLLTLEHIDYRICVGFPDTPVVMHLELPSSPLIASGAFKKLALQYHPVPWSRLWDRGPASVRRFCDDMAT